VAAASAAGGNITTGAINTSGAFLIAAHVVWQSTATSPVFADSLGNTWLQVPSQTENGVGTLFYSIFPKTGAGHTFSISASNLSYGALCVAAFSEAGYTASLDQSSGAGSSGSVATFQPGSVTPTVNGEVLITGIAFGGSASAMSIDSGFAITDFRPNVPGDSYGCSLAYMVQPAAAAVNPTWTATSGSMALPVSSIATFKVFLNIANARVYQSAFEIVALGNPYAQVSQSAFEIVALGNPYAQVSQSALELVVIPGPTPVIPLIGVQIIFRGVKRSPDSTSEPLEEVQEAPHVQKAV
jgi:hypothetical protein